MAFKLTGGRQYRNAGKLPAVDVTEASDGISVIAIPRAPGSFHQHVGAQVNHPKRSAGGTEEEPPGVGGVDVGINQVDWQQGGMTGIAGAGR